MNVRTAVVCAAAITALSGCGYRPGGPGYSDDTFTYISQPHNPVTVTLVDTRTEKPVWTYEVPAGRQLTIRFLDDYAPDNTMSPTKFTWQEMERGTHYGTLENSMLVPDRTARRLDVEYRTQPELPQGVSASADGTK